jgi:hypothetical protein
VVTFDAERGTFDAGHWLARRHTGRKASMGRWILVLLVVLAACALPACALFTGEEPAPVPGSPRIAHLRFEPDVVVAGQHTIMSFYFEVPTADLKEGMLIERGIAQFQLYQTLNPISVDLRQYSGQVAGTAEVAVRWSELGVRFLELYVITEGGRTSNRIYDRLTVR